MVGTGRFHLLLARANKLLAASCRDLLDVFFSSHQLRGYLLLGNLEGGLHFSDAGEGQERVGSENRELDPWLLVGNEKIRNIVSEVRC